MTLERKVFSRAIAQSEIRPFNFHLTINQFDRTSLPNNHRSLPKIIFESLPLWNNSQSGSCLATTTVKCHSQNYLNKGHVLSPLSLFQNLKKNLFSISTDTGIIFIMQYIYIFKKMTIQEGKAFDKRILENLRGKK